MPTACQTRPIGWEPLCDTDVPHSPQVVVVRVAPCLAAWPRRRPAHPAPAQAWLAWLGMRFAHHLKAQAPNHEQRAYEEALGHRVVQVGHDLKFTACGAASE